MKTLVILAVIYLIGSHLGVNLKSIIRDRKYIFMGLAMTVPVFFIWAFVSALIIL